MYRLRLNALYHSKRERHFALVDKWLTIGTTVAATGAVMTLLKQAETVDITVSVVTAIMSLMTVVFNPAERARHHGLKAADFRRLRARAVAAGEQWTAVQCDALLAEALELEVEDEAPLSAVVADCQNMLGVGQDGAENIALSWWVRLWMNWWPFDAASLKAQSDAKAKARAKPL